MRTINSLLVLLFASTLLVAQHPTATSLKPIQHRKRVHRILKPTISATPNPAPKTSTDFFVGEARVDVTKDETVVRLAMAQHGSILIELPANDGPRYIIPGDPELATVDEKALERNKRAIVVRPGTQFVSPPHNLKARNPAATVTAQMRSGLVVTFLFYPVEDLAQNVHRCVLNYNRDEVVARRRAAGLPVNLDDKEQGGENTTAQSAVTPIATDTESPKGDKPKNSAPTKPDELSSATQAKEKEANEASDEIGTSLRKALDEATKRPKLFKKWTRETHGVKLSVLQGLDSEKPFKLVTVAVKNATGDSLKLVADGPELFVETVDEKGTTVNVHSVAKTQIVGSTSGAIAAHTTAYFVIAYVSPVIDAHQHLKIVVAQTNAADEPASIKLAASGR